MNEIFHPNGASNITGSASDRLMPVPDTSMLPGTGQAAPVAVNALNRVVQGAHDAIDRFADSTEPRVRQLGESASAAETSLRATAGRLDKTRLEWTDSLRGTVRTHPLAAVAAGLALGALFMRLTR